MPAVILIPKLLMPIRAFIPAMPIGGVLDNHEFDFENLAEFEPVTYRWSVQVLMKDDGGIDRLVGMVEDGDQQLLPPFKPGWRSGTEIEEGALNPSV